ncbi:MAG: acyl-CoA dehydrogenase [Gammaproteobacteria bacterium]|nr:acyl-CoA dehydrogenase [Gammaproteobacteria bacterium]
MPYASPVQDAEFCLNHLLAQRDDVDQETSSAILLEAAKIADNLLAPYNASGDHAHSSLDNQGNVTTPAGFKEGYQAMIEGGWVGLTASEAYQGMGLPQRVGAAVSEFWQGSNMSFALCPLLTQGLIQALTLAGSEAQKQTYLTKLSTGEWSGTMNLTEPQAGTDLAAIRTVATPCDDGSGLYRLKGQKIYITYGEHDMAENIVHLVLARTPDAPPGLKGISVFVVPKFLVNADGSLGERNDVRCVSIEKKMGIKASPTAVLSYGESEGALGELVGDLGRGLEYMFIMMNEARFHVGLQGLAISEAARQHALAYAHDRLQGTPIAREPGTPIIGHGDVKRLLMIMRASTESMRALGLYTADQMDLAHAGQGDQARVELMIPIVKGWFTEMSQEITRHGVQVFGGMGFIEETGAAQFMRDARILTIYEGTTAIQANDLIFRKTLRDNGSAVKRLIADIRADARVSALDCKKLASACSEVEGALSALLRTEDKAAVSALGTDWIMALGYLCGGWMCAVSKSVAQQKVDQLGTEFVARKQTACAVYFDHLLPRIKAHTTTIGLGGNSVLSVEDALV